MKFTSFATGLSVLAAQAFALFESVEVLNADNFDEMVINDTENMWMVTFYADWCPYCEPFSPELEAAQLDTALADKHIKFGAVNVMENRDLTMHYGVARSPSVKIFGLDREAPEDYTGHRKREELVAYLNEYAETNEYVVPPPPEPETAKYLYNIGSIVDEIRSAHGERIYAAEAAHKEALAGIGEQGTADLTQIKGDFDVLLEALINERTTAISESKQTTVDLFVDASTTHADNIATLDQEAIDTIDLIWSTHEADQELTDYIPTLGKDWFNIEWTDYNRRMKPEEQPVIATQVTYDDQHYGQEQQYVEDPQAYDAGYGQEQQYGDYNQYQAPQAYDSYQQYQEPAQQNYQEPAQQNYQEPAQQNYQEPAQQNYQEPAQNQYQQYAQPAYQQYAQPAYQQPQNQYSAGGYGGYGGY